MNVLLDTHTFIWFNMADARLTREARQLITRPDTTAFISPASYWEIAVKIDAGKFTLAAPYETFWQSGLDGNGFQILPIELRHTNRLIDLPRHHKDPFDRLLVA